MKAEEVLKQLKKGLSLELSNGKRGLKEILRRKDYANAFAWDQVNKSIQETLDLIWELENR